MHKAPITGAVLLGLALAACDGGDGGGSGDPNKGSITGRLTFGVSGAESFFQMPGRAPQLPANLPQMLEPMRRGTHRGLLTTHGKPSVAAGEVLVRFDSPDAVPGQVLENSLLLGYEFTYQTPVTRTWHLLRARRVDGMEITASETFEIAQRLSTHLRLTATEVNRIAYPMASVPQDPLYKYQWHYGQIQLPSAWDVTKGSSAVTVAVVDTGILPNHPDLKGRLVQGIDMISDSSRAQDGDGRDNDPTDLGRDLPQDQSSWHGSHVAGTIGAATENGAGVAGVDWNCRILPVRALGKEGGTNADIVAGVAWAAGIPVPGTRTNDHPAQVINLSLGGDGPPSQLYQDVIDEVVQRGGIVVVAAGNENEDTANKTPANQQNVIAVGAVAYTGARASYSNFGAEVDLLAPGGEMSEDADGDGFPDGVFSTYAGETGTPKYDYLQGTSMASPHIAGIVGLMKAVNPSMTFSAVEQALKDTAVAGYRCPEGCGNGLVNAYAAVLRAGGTTPTGPGKLAVPNRELNLVGSATGSIAMANTGGTAITVSATAGGANASRVSFPSGSSRTLAPAQADALEVAVDADGLSSGEYKATVTLSAAGSSVPVGVTFRVGGNGSGKSVIVGAVYLDENDEWQVGGGAEGTSSAAAADYRIDDLEPGEYYVLAGVDDNGNGEYFDEGERIGFWRNLESPEAVVVTAGKITSGINMALLASGLTPEEGTGSVAIGSPCSNDADCGAGGQCDSAMPGGYCYTTCPGTTSCPSGSSCFELADPPLCIATCNSPGGGQSNCRSGYLCWATTSEPICWPPCTELPCDSGTCNASTGYCE